MDPFAIRFSQSSISCRFRDGSSIDDLADELRSGRTRPEDLPPIRLVECGRVLRCRRRRWRL
jgi:hypothetical protein